MKLLDRYLQNVRINKAKNYIRKNDCVLDVGSVDGVMFEKWRGLIGKSVGVDPTLNDTIEKDFYTLYPGYFPEACPQSETFNVITILAVLEHIPTSRQAQLAIDCHQEGRRMRGKRASEYNVPTIEACAIVGVTRATMIKLAARGLVPARRKGYGKTRPMYFRVADLEPLRKLYQEGEDVS